MEDIYQYILKTKEERQAHLDLGTYCIERGGKSTYSKALLAEHVGTTIPSGHSIHVCHACHNGLCSNVLHLYWGTAQENRRDRVYFTQHYLNEDYAYHWRRSRATKLDNKLK